MTLLEKLLSRKFLVTIMFFVTVIVIVSTGNRSTQDVIEIIKTLWPVAVYIAGEAAVDIASAGKAPAAPPADPRG